MTNTHREHRHRPVPARHKTVGWSHCVSGRADCDAAHGAVTLIDRCYCGAVRKIESNGRHQASSGWTAPIPSCAASMGCLCAGHARGNDAGAACDTSETP